MNWSIRLLACIGICFCSAAVAADNQHLCTQSDLVNGTWNLLTMTETPERREAGLYHHMPNQYLAFYPDHFYSFVITDEPVKAPAQIAKDLQWAQAAGRSLKYTIDDKGVLNLYIDNKMKYSYRCVSIGATAGGYKKGDLILTGYTRKKTQLYKLYRRWF